MCLSLMFLNGRRLSTGWRQCRLILVEINPRITISRVPDNERCLTDLYSLDFNTLVHDVFFFHLGDASKPTAFILLQNNRPAAHIHREDKNCNCVIYRLSFALTVFW